MRGISEPCILRAGSSRMTAFQGSCWSYIASWNFGRSKSPPKGEWTQKVTPIPNWVSQPRDCKCWHLSLPSPGQTSAQFFLVLYPNTDANLRDYQQIEASTRQCYCRAGRRPWTSQLSSLSGGSVAPLIAFNQQTSHFKGSVVACPQKNPEEGRKFWLVGQYPRDISHFQQALHPPA